MQERGRVNLDSPLQGSQAGLLWRDILKQKGIQVRQWQFCKLNLPLAVVSMVVSCAVLV